MLWDSLEPHPPKINTQPKEARTQFPKSASPSFRPRARTWVSVSMSDVATSKRLGRDKYLLSLNWCSSSNSCWLVKAVRGRRHFPKRLDCAWAVGGKDKRPL